MFYVFLFTIYFLVWVSMSYRFLFQDLHFWCWYSNYFFWFIFYYLIFQYLTYSNDRCHMCTLISSILLNFDPWFSCNFLFVYEYLLLLVNFILSFIVFLIDSYLIIRLDFNGCTFLLFLLFWFYSPLLMCFDE